MDKDERVQDEPGADEVVENEGFEDEAKVDECPEAREGEYGFSPRILLPRVPPQKPHRRKLQQNSGQWSGV